MTIEIFSGSPEALAAKITALAPATIQVIPTHQNGKYLLIYT